MSPSIFDILPLVQQQEYADSKIKIGLVIKGKVFDTDPHKIKYFIIVGLSPDNTSIATIYINSEINTFKLNRGYLFSQQFMVKKQDCSFLDHDSYANCAEIKEKEYSVVRDFILNDSNSCVGNINNDYILRILEIIRNSRTIPPKIKNRYLFEFSTSS